MLPAAFITRAYDAKRDNCPLVPTRPAGWKPDLVPTAPVDRAAAGEGVHRLYRDVGLAPPHIIWCDGPVALARHWASTASSASVGSNIKATVTDLWQRRAMQRAGASDDQDDDLVTHDPSWVIGGAIEGAVLDEVGALRPSFFSWLRDQASWSGWLDGRRPSFSNSGYGPQDLLSLPNIRLADDQQRRKFTQLSRGWSSVVQNAGWLVPHERVCWLAEGPKVLCCDDEGRLHCASGPALQYRDGWTLYVWKGVTVPSWCVEKPEKITLEWIDAQIDPRVRHAMIDILTPERFIAARGADWFASDDAGTLWKRKWSHRGTTIDAWAALELTGEMTTIHPVPPNLSTPRQALAWLSSVRVPVKPPNGRL